MITNVHVNISNIVFENSLSNKYKSLCYKKLTKDEKYNLLIAFELLNCGNNNLDFIMLQNNLKNVF